MMSKGFAGGLRSVVVAVAVMACVGIQVSRAEVADSDTAEVGVIVYTGSETPTVTASETPAASATPEPTEPASGPETTPATVKGLPNTGDGQAGTSPAAMFTLISGAGAAFLAAAMLVRRRPSP